MIITILIPGVKPASGTKNTLTLVINDYCPSCGGRRGEPKEVYFEEHKATLSVWSNPCGHVDYYNKLMQQWLRRLYFTYRGRGDRYRKTYFGPNPFGIRLKH